MRTSIEIDDELMRRAMRSSPNRTKREVVEEGLRILVEMYSQVKIRRPRGKVYPNITRR